MGLDDLLFQAVHLRFCLLLGLLILRGGPAVMGRHPPLRREILPRQCRRRTWRFFVAPSRHSTGALRMSGSLRGIRMPSSMTSRNSPTFRSLTEAMKGCGAGPPTCEAFSATFA